MVYCLGPGYWQPDHLRSLVILYYAQQFATVYGCKLKYVLCAGAPAVVSLQVESVLCFRQVLPSLLQVCT